MCIACLFSCRTCLLSTNQTEHLIPHAQAASTAFWMVTRGNQQLTMLHSICRVQWRSSWQALPGGGWCSAAACGLLIRFPKQIVTPDKDLHAMMQVTEPDREGDCHSAEDCCCRHRCSIPAARQSRGPCWRHHGRVCTAVRAAPPGRQHRRLVCHPVRTACRLRGGHCSSHSRQGGGAVHRTVRSTCWRQDSSRHVGFRARSAGPGAVGTAQP